MTEMQSLGYRTFWYFDTNFLKGVFIWAICQVRFHETMRFSGTRYATSTKLSIYACTSGAGATRYATSTKLSIFASGASLIKLVLHNLQPNGRKLRTFQNVSGNLLSKFGCNLKSKIYTWVKFYVIGTPGDVAFVLVFACPRYSIFLCLIPL